MTVLQVMAALTLNATAVGIQKRQNTAIYYLEMMNGLMPDLNLMITFRQLEKIAIQTPDGNNVQRKVYIILGCVLN